MFMRKTLSIMATTAIVLSVAAFSPTDDRTAKGRPSAPAETMAPAIEEPAPAPQVMDTATPSAPPVYVPPTNEITVTTPAANPPEMGTVTIPETTMMPAATVATTAHPSSDDWKNHIYDGKKKEKKAKPAKKRKVKKKAVEAAPVATAPAETSTEAPATSAPMTDAQTTDAPMTTDSPAATPSLTTEPADTTSGTAPAVTTTEPATATEPTMADPLAADPLATDMGAGTLQNDVPVLTTPPTTTP